MTTPRRLRRDQRERTPKVVLRWKGSQMLTREEAMTLKAQFKRAGSVAVVNRDWDVIWAPQRERDEFVTVEIDTQAYGYFEKRTAPEYIPEHNPSPPSSPLIRSSWVLAWAFGVVLLAVWIGLSA